MLHFEIDGKNTKLQDGDIIKIITDFKKTTFTVWRKNRILQHSEEQLEWARKFFRTENKSVPQQLHNLTDRIEEFKKKISEFLSVKILYHFHEKINNSEHHFSLLIQK
jgi:hypothetical protein